MTEMIKESDSSDVVGRRNAGCLCILEAKNVEIFVGILLGIVGLFLIYQVVKFNLFLKIAIGRVKEKKSQGKIRGADEAERAYEKECITQGEWLLRRNIEEVTIQGKDGVSLVGHYIKAENQQRVILAFHGWHGSWKKDFAICAKTFLENGCGLLLVEQRAHGKSGGRYIGFGILERHDCKCWTEYAYERFGADMPVYLYGVSMGASTVLMASGLSLPENIKGIVADCGFTLPYDMVVRFADKILKKHEFPDVPFINKLCRRRAGYSFREYSTLEAMRVCRLPILFIHGLKDEFVPYYMTLLNYHECKAEKKLLLVEGAGHCHSFFKEKVRYMEEMRSFFRWTDAKTC